MRKPIIFLALMLILLLAACAAAPEPFAAATPLPPATATAAAQPTPQATSRGDRLEASDPASLRVGEGKPVLVEFFRFT